MDFTMIETQVFRFKFENFNYHKIKIFTGGAYAPYAPCMGTPLGRAYVVTEAMLRSAQEPVCRKHSHKASGVTSNNCKGGPLTSLTVAIDACYILLPSQRFQYSNYHSFEYNHKIKFK